MKKRLCGDELLVLFMVLMLIVGFQICLRREENLDFELAS